MLENLRKLKTLFNRRDKVIFLLLIGMMIIGALMEIMGLGIVPVFVAVLADPQRALANRYAGPLLKRFDLLQPEKMVYFGSAALILMFFLKNSYLVFNRYLQLRVLKNRQIMLMSRLFRAYMHSPYEFHLQRNTAELLRNVNGETQMICQAVLSPIMSLCMSGIITFSILLMLVLVNFWITLVSVLVLAVAAGLLLNRFQRKVRLLGKRAQVERKEIVKTVNQGLGSVKEIRLMHREAFFVKDLSMRARSLAAAQTYQEIIGGSVGYYLETVAVFTLLLLCVLLVAFGKPIQSIAPTLALFGVALVRLKATVSQMVGGINTLLFQSHCVTPVYEDLRRLEQPSSEAEYEAPEPLPFRESIELRSVAYHYPEAHCDVLIDVNLRIEKGSSVAFIGPTGAGKTTLIDVVLGLLPPSQGCVVVDGADIRKNLAGWQRNIGYVPQAIYLTDDTIRRNIALGMADGEIEEEKVWTAVRSAQLEDFVRSLPEGLDSLVGERGTRISGGQRQRIGIARALYHDPDVLVLDEGTSALDNQTEAAVIDAVENLRGSRTILMIAHRLSTTENCDFRYRVENGRVQADLSILGAAEG